MELMFFMYAALTIWVLMGARVYLAAYKALLFKMPPTPSVERFKENLNLKPKRTKLTLFLICILLWPILTNLI